jgi:benzoyl-CoA-dihydrodiol lyase
VSPDPESTQDRAAAEQETAVTQPPRVEYQTDPSRYRHWKLTFEGPVATLAMDVDADGGLRDGYKLKLNSYDLGVDIELNDALNRIRFEHPEVRTVVVTSLKDKVFCSGANIFMLGLSSHAWKVNFCKFTNETRNGIEDSSAHSGLKFLAAVNGSCAGGGYELALACDEIILVDDRSSAVSLPEVPLLGVLPGTGGLTRVTDKRHVRHDLADIFCTTNEGVRGQKAVAWRLVDDIAKPAVFAAKVQERALQLAAQSDRPADGQGVALPPLQRVIEADALRYRHVTVQIDRAGPPRHLHREGAQRRAAHRRGRHRSRRGRLVPAGDGARARRRHPADAHQRTRHRAVAHQDRRRRRRRAGHGRHAAAARRPLAGARDHGPAAPHLQPPGRVQPQPVRADRAGLVLCRQLPGTGAGLRPQLHAGAARRRRAAPTVTVGDANFGLYPMATGQSRLGRRFYDEQPALEAVRAKAGQALDADAAFAVGLVTSNPDDIDWADETRIAIEERVAMSPDALTGMEANLRFNGPENMATRIFGRLTAWQNWIFQRPNAVGEKGALKVYGKGDKAAFDWSRV